MMSFKLLCFVAVGGAMGTVGRYVSTIAINEWFAVHSAYGTFFVNIVGSFLLGGLMAGFSLGWEPSLEVRTLLQVGVLGAFTTFSAFSMDIFDQVSRGDYIASAVNVGGSVFIGVVALVAGMAVTRHLYT